MQLLKAAGALALVQAVAAKEMAVNEKLSAEVYRSGIMMDRIMERKQADWSSQRAAGAYESAQYPPIDGPIKCVNGVAAAIPGDAKNTFKCKNMDLYAFKSHSELGSKVGQGSSSWGWTSPEGREFVAIGQADGAAFIEITKDGQISYLGRLQGNAAPVIWRELRGYKDYMVIGSEAAGHGIQIFDMKKLLTIDPASPQTFDKKLGTTGFYSKLPQGKTHNVVINEDSGFAFAVGASPRTDKCKSGLIFIDLKDPANPTSPGCAAQDGYVHDAQCVMYKGPDARYNGKEICYGYNEDSLTIYDVTNKTAPTIVSRTSYEGVAYCHQGWVLDKQNQHYLIMDDEYDEIRKTGLAKGQNPISYIWDISNLQKPRQTGYFKSQAKSVDHNMYIHDGKAYQSNYGSGFRILDVSSIPQDPTGGSVKEVAFFDVYPEDDAAPGGGRAAFVGSWSSYAYFKSGYIYVNTIERGGFVVKYTGQ